MQRSRTRIEIETNSYIKPVSSHSPFGIGGMFSASDGDDRNGWLWEVFSGTLCS